MTSNPLNYYCLECDVRVEAGTNIPRQGRCSTHSVKDGRAFGRKLVLDQTAESDKTVSDLLKEAIGRTSKKELVKLLFPVTVVERSEGPTAVHGHEAEQKWSILALATWVGDVDLVKRLLAPPAQIQFPNAPIEPILTNVIGILAKRSDVMPSHVEVFHNLARGGVELHQCYKVGKEMCPPFLLAVYNRCLPLVSAFLSHMKNTEKIFMPQKFQGLTAIHIAVQHNWLEGIKCLLEEDPDWLNLKAEPDKDTPLMMAVKQGSVEMVTLLLEAHTTGVSSDSNAVRVMKKMKVTKTLNKAQKTAVCIAFELCYKHAGDSEKYKEVRDILINFIVTNYLLQVFLCFIMEGLPPAIHPQTRNMESFLPIMQFIAEKGLSEKRYSDAICYVEPWVAFTSFYRNFRTYVIWSPKTVGQVAYILFLLLRYQSGMVLRYFLNHGGGEALWRMLEFYHCCYDVEELEWAATAIALPLQAFSDWLRGRDWIKVYVDAISSPMWTFHKCKERRLKQLQPDNMRFLDGTYHNLDCLVKYLRPRLFEYYDKNYLRWKHSQFALSSPVEKFEMSPTQMSETVGGEDAGVPAEAEAVHVDGSRQGIVDGIKSIFSTVWSYVSPSGDKGRPKSETEEKEGPPSPEEKFPEKTRSKVVRALGFEEESRRQQNLGTFAELAADHDAQSVVVQTNTMESRHRSRGKPSSDVVPSRQSPSRKQGEVSLSVPKRQVPNNPQNAGIPRQSNAPMAPSAGDTIQSKLRNMTISSLDELMADLRSVIEKAVADQETEVAHSASGVPKPKDRPTKHKVGQISVDIESMKLALSYVEHHKETRRLRTPPPTSVTPARGRGDTATRLWNMPLPDLERIIASIRAKIDKAISEERVAVSEKTKPEDVKQKVCHEISIESMKRVLAYVEYHLTARKSGIQKPEDTSLPDTKEQERFDKLKEKSTDVVWLSQTDGAAASKRRDIPHPKETEVEPNPGALRSRLEEHSPCFREVKQQVVALTTKLGMPKPEDIPSPDALLKVGKAGKLMSVPKRDDLPPSERGQSESKPGILATPRTDGFAKARQGEQTLPAPEGSKMGTPRPEDLLLPEGGEVETNIGVTTSSMRKPSAQIMNGKRTVPMPPMPKSQRATTQELPRLEVESVKTEAGPNKPVELGGLERTTSEAPERDLVLLTSQKPKPEAAPPPDDSEGKTNLDCVPTLTENLGTGCASSKSLKKSGPALSKSEMMMTKLQKKVTQVKALETLTLPLNMEEQKMSREMKDPVVISTKTGMSNSVAAKTLRNEVQLQDASGTMVSEKVGAKQERSALLTKAIKSEDNMPTSRIEQTMVPTRSVSTLEMLKVKKGMSSLRKQNFAKEELVRNRESKEQEKLLLKRPHGEAERKGSDMNLTSPEAARIVKPSDHVKVTTQMGVSGNIGEGLTQKEKEGTPSASSSQLSKRSDPEKAGATRGVEISSKVANKTKSKLNEAENKTKAKPTVPQKENAKHESKLGVGKGFDRTEAKAMAQRKENASGQAVVETSKKVDQSHKGKETTQTKVAGLAEKGVERGSDKLTPIVPQMNKDDCSTKTNLLPSSNRSMAVVGQRNENRKVEPKTQPMVSQNKSDKIAKEISKERKRCQVCNLIMIPRSDGIKGKASPGKQCVVESSKVPKETEVTNDEETPKTVSRGVRHQRDVEREVDQKKSDKEKVRVLVKDGGKTESDREKERTDARIATGRGSKDEEQLAGKVMTDKGMVGEEEVKPEQRTGIGKEGVEVVEIVQAGSTLVETAIKETSEVKMVPTKDLTKVKAMVLPPVAVEKDTKEVKDSVKVDGLTARRKGENTTEKLDHKVIENVKKVQSSAKPQNTGEEEKLKVPQVVGREAEQQTKPNEMDAVLLGESHRDRVKGPPVKVGKAEKEVQLQGRNVKTESKATTGKSDKGKKRTNVGNASTKNDDKGNVRDKADPVRKAQTELQEQPTDVRTVAGPLKNRAEDMASPIKGGKGEETEGPKDCKAKNDTKGLPKKAKEEAKALSPEVGMAMKRREQVNEKPTEVQQLDGTTVAKPADETKTLSHDGGMRGKESVQVKEGHAVEQHLDGEMIAKPADNHRDRVKVDAECDREVEKVKGSKIGRDTQEGTEALPIEDGSKEKCFASTMTKEGKEKTKVHVHVKMEDSTEQKTTHKLIPQKLPEPKGKPKNETVKGKALVGSVGVNEDITEVGVKVGSAEQSVKADDSIKQEAGTLSKETVLTPDSNAKKIESTGVQSTGMEDLTKKVQDSVEGAKAVADGLKAGEMTMPKKNGSPVSTASQTSPRKRKRQKKKKKPEAGECPEEKVMAGNGCISPRKGKMEKTLSIIKENASEDPLIQRKGKKHVPMKMPEVEKSQQRETKQKTAVENEQQDEAPVEQKEVPGLSRERTLLVSMFTPKGLTVIVLSEDAEKCERAEVESSATEVQGLDCLSEDAEKCERAEVESSAIEVQGPDCPKDLTVVVLSEDAEKCKRAEVESSATEGQGPDCPKDLTVVVLSEDAEKCERAEVESSATEVQGPDCPKNLTVVVLSEDAVKCEGAEAESSATEVQGFDCPKDLTVRVLSEDTEKCEAAEVESSATEIQRPDCPKDLTVVVLSEDADKCERAEVESSATEVQGLDCPTDLTVVVLSEDAEKSDRAEVESSTTEVQGLDCPTDLTVVVLSEDAEKCERAEVESSATEVQGNVVKDVAEDENEAEAKEKVTDAEKLASKSKEVRVGETTEKARPKDAPVTAEMTGTGSEDCRPGVSAESISDVAEQKEGDPCVTITEELVPASVTEPTDGVTGKVREGSDRDRVAQPKEGVPCMAADQTSAMTQPKETAACLSGTLEVTVAQPQESVISEKTVDAAQMDALTQPKECSTSDKTEVDVVRADKTAREKPVVAEQHGTVHVAQPRKAVTSEKTEAVDVQPIENVADGTGESAVSAEQLEESFTTVEKTETHPKDDATAEQTDSRTQPKHVTEVNCLQQSDFEMRQVGNGTFETTVGNFKEELGKTSQKESNGYSLIQNPFQGLPDFFRADTHFEMESLESEVSAQDIPDMRVEFTTELCSEVVADFPTVGSSETERRCRKLRNLSSKEQVTSCGLWDKGGRGDGQSLWKMPVPEEDKGAKRTCFAGFDRTTWPQHAFATEDALTYVMKVQSYLTDHEKDSLSSKTTKVRQELCLGTNLKKFESDLHRQAVCPPRKKHACSKDSLCSEYRYLLAVLNTNYRKVRNSEKTEKQETVELDEDELWVSPFWEDAVENQVYEDTFPTLYPESLGGHFSEVLDIPAGSAESLYYQEAGEMVHETLGYWDPTLDQNEVHQELSFSDHDAQPQEPDDFQEQHITENETDQSDVTVQDPSQSGDQYTNGHLLAVQSPYCADVVANQPQVAHLVQEFVRCNQDWLEFGNRWRSKFELFNSLPPQCLTLVGPGGPLICLNNIDLVIGVGLQGGVTLLGMGPDRSAVAVTVVDNQRYSQESEAWLACAQPHICHENMVKFMGIFLTPQGVFITSELCQGTLDQHIGLMKANGGVPDMNAMTMSQEMLVGLDYLHDMDILHKNIRPTNIFLTTRGTVKLGKFGFDPRPTAQSQHLGILDPCCWQPAELLIFPTVAHYSKKSDVQVCGMVIHYIQTGGEHPFGQVCYDIITNITLGNHTMQMTDSKMATIVEKMLQVTPNDRPDVKAVLGAWPFGELHVADRE